MPGLSRVKSIEGSRKSTTSTKVYARKVNLWSKITKVAYLLSKVFRVMLIINELLLHKSQFE